MCTNSLRNGNDKGMEVCCKLRASSVSGINSQEMLSITSLLLVACRCSRIIVKPRAATEPRRSLLGLSRRILDARPPGVSELEVQFSVGVDNGEGEQAFLMPSKAMAPSAGDRVAALANDVVWQLGPDYFNFSTCECDPVGCCSIEDAHI